MKSCVLITKPPGKLSETLDVPIDDLWAAASGFSEDAYADFCHFTPEGFRQLGIAAAAFIRKKLSE